MSNALPIALLLGLSYCQLLWRVVQKMLPDCTSHISSPEAINPAAASGPVLASRIVQRRENPCRNDDQAQALSDFPNPAATGSGAATILVFAAFVTTAFTRLSHSAIAACSNHAILLPAPRPPNHPIPLPVHYMAIVSRHPPLP